jgi:glutamate/tyrosine decarboxylase-like PLP-dependent enzyme
LRKKYEQLGLSFIVHCDAAWGGYFTSTLRDRAKGATRTGKPDYVPIKTISPYTKAQLNHIKWSDSVTIDPHKYAVSGGSMCLPIDLLTSSGLVTVHTRQVDYVIEI